jgi:tetratricopeptide (TPR) repeat protein
MKSLRSNRAIFAALLGAALGGCATSQKSGGRSQSSEQAERGDRRAADPAREAKKPGEIQLNARSQRLFEDALRSYQDMRKARSVDWQVLEKKYREVVDADDRFAEAYFNLGVTLERQRRVDDARRAYKAALSRKPTLRQAAENLAVIAQNEGRREEALELYQEILRKQPEDGAARARLAAIYREAGDHQRALSLAREALMREPQNLTAYKVMMRVYVERNNLPMAKLIALQASKLGAGDPELFQAMGLIALKDGDESLAVSHFRRAIQERDDYLPARYQLADLALHHRNWAQAAEQYARILQYDPKSTAARVNLGLSYRGMGQPDKALEEYERAIESDSSAAATYFNVGVVLHKDKDAPEKALEYYRKFIALSGGSVPAAHPVQENVRECEQSLRALREAKAAEERAAAEKKVAEERAKAEGDEKKRSEEPKKAERPEEKPKAKEPRAKEARPANRAASKASEPKKSRDGDEPEDDVGADQASTR